VIDPHGPLYKPGSGLERRDMVTQQLLEWLRGTGLQIAAAVFVLGMVYRMLHLLLLGRKPNLAVPRGSEWRGGLRTMWHRSLPSVGLTPRGYFIVIVGYIFHLGFLIVLLFLAQHIDVLRAVFRFGWPALPPSLITITAILTIAAMIALLVHRITDPVKRLISDYQDYLTWVLTFLPLLTGLMLKQGSVFDYQHMLILHLLSVELLLIAIPFTKLVHMLTTFSARWYNGAMAGFKGTQA
jgi:nitrate reductase gamma subunit